MTDEIGYLPLERQAANLLFALIARRCERGSIIVTSNRGFEAWARSSATQWSPPLSSTASSITPPWSP